MLLTRLLVLPSGIVDAIHEQFGEQAVVGLVGQLVHGGVEPNELVNERDFSRLRRRRTVNRLF